MSLDRAIIMLEEEVASFQQGTKSQPTDGSADWFVLRAKALGLSHLRRIKLLELERDSGGAERLYRRSISQLKLIETPLPEAPVGGLPV